MIERRVRVGGLSRLRLALEEDAHTLADWTEHQGAQVDGAGRLDTGGLARTRSRKLIQPAVGRPS